MIATVEEAQKPPKPRAAATLLSRVGKRFVRLSAGVFLLGAGGSALSYYALVKTANFPKTLDGFYVDFNLDELSISETGGDSDNYGPLSPFFLESQKRLSLKQTLDALHKAKVDERCKGMLLRSSGSLPKGNDWLSGSPATMAMMQEIRSALCEFSSQKEKISMAAFNTFGELGTANGLQAYTLATAMKEVYVQPTGHLSIMGMASRAPFFREFLNKWKVEPFVVKRNKYKNALNNFEHSSYTAEHREATDHLLGTLFEQCLHDISTSTGVDTRALRRHIDKAPLTADQAKDAELITDVQYGSWVREMIGIQTLKKVLSEVLEDKKNMQKTRAYEKMVWDANVEEKVRMRMQDYAAAVEAEKMLDSIHNKISLAWRNIFRGLGPNREDEKVSPKQIALVYAEGAILNGSSGSSGKAIEGTRLAQVLQKLSRNPKVKGVVLRVDSPGGSVVGSDEIWNEVRNLESLKVPVVVSMGNVCASGGYYISCPASRILASPGTLTGSIGVIMGKFNFEGFFKDLGVKFDEGKTFGKNATMMSPTTSYTRAQRRQINRMIDSVYDEFLRKVEEGRSMQLRMVKRIANGRVWTGQDAYRLGLVDQLGGLHDAIEAAKLLSGAGEEARVVEVKTKKSLLRRFREAGLSSFVTDSVVSSILADFFNSPSVDVGMLKSLMTQCNGKPVLLDPSLLFYR